MIIKDIIGLLIGKIEIWKDGTTPNCSGFAKSGGDCMRCVFFDEGNMCCTGEHWEEYSEKSLYEGYAQDMPYRLSDLEIESICPEYIKPYGKPREACKYIKIKVKGDTE